MKPRRFLPCMALMLLVAATSSRAALPPPLRILPLGDSITLGTGVPGGYRAPLHQLLSQAGYTVEFVGSLDSNGSPDLPYPRHDGFSGARIQDLDRLVAGSLDTNPDPDIILLLAGTNDFGTSDAVDTASDRLEALVVKLATERPATQIIVANLIQRSERSGVADRVDRLIRTIFNPRIPGIVERQAALGRKVSFTDMRSSLELSDTSDRLHPNALGSRKMATNWLQAIQRVSGPFGDAHPPSVVRVESQDLESLRVTFSKAVRQDSIHPTNFMVQGGSVEVLEATLDSVSQREVLLRTSPQTVFASYSLEVRRVRDMTPEVREIRAGEHLTYIARPRIGRGPFRNVPEASEYRILYAFDIPAGINCCTEAVYDLDFQENSPEFERVAYYMELRKPNEPIRFVWASMDTFTSMVPDLGLPNAARGGAYQKTVERMNIFSNVKGLPTGTNLAGGSIEFGWADYRRENGAGIPQARTDSYDWGDTFVSGTPSTGSNYGAIQVHYPPAGRVLLAFNGFGGEGGIADVGIGNRPGSLDVDWSLSANADDYAERRLYVLGRPKGPPPAPVLLRAVATPDGHRVLLEFDAPLDDSAADTNLYRLDRDVQVLGAQLDSTTKSHVELRTTSLPSEGSTRIGIDGLRARTASGTNVSSQTNLIIERPHSPAYDRVSEAKDYRMVFDFPIPTARPPYTDAGSTYAKDYSSLDRDPIVRVAYYMELAREIGGTTNWVWVSMEAFTQRARHIGLPDAGGGAQFHKGLTNLTVASNVPGIATGNQIATGYMEFWAWGYDDANALGVVGASDRSFDWGDKPLPIKNKSFADTYGSMQIHNITPVGTPHVLFAFNGWGGANHPRLDVGIGNGPVANRDWTLLQNSHEYAVKNLHMFVKTGEPSGPIRAVISREGAGWRVRARGTPGRVYQLERSRDLLEWTAIGTTEAEEDGGVALLDANPSPAATFYRIAN